MTTRPWISLLLAGALSTSIFGIGSWTSPSSHNLSNPPSPPAAPDPWNPKQAATYLDSREVWWQQWPRAQKDHGTLCISCHTTVPYALARPALRQQMHEPSAPNPELTLISSIKTRVNRWPEMIPFYSDAVSGPGKTAESHATEAVLNAIILTSYDIAQPSLRPVTRTALDEAWALQLPSGGWQWQNFDLGPWESTESSYQGAALLFLQVEAAPHRYAAEPSAQNHVARLRQYLQRQYPTQPIMSQLYVLWACSKTPDLLTSAQRAALLQQLQTLQQADGGWRLSALDKTKRLDDSPEPTESDGLATALAVLAMEESGTAPQNSLLSHGLQWLRQHQQPTGNWPASSLNKQRDPTGDIGLFMSDAATGYAVLALQNAATGSAK